VKWKYSVITGFLGGLRDRFIEYQPARSIESILDLAAGIKGCSGVELVYPSDFADLVKLKELLAARGLGVSSVNVNVKSEEKFRFGSVTSPDASVRAEAVRHLTEAMDSARQLGCNLVTSAFLSDGSDYPLELDYVRAFRDGLEAVRQAAADAPDVKLSLEYKASEPLSHCFLNNAGKAAYFAMLTGCDNVGVTLDIGHAFQSGEVPADSVSFLGSTGRLFYVHINDNYRNWDWDLLPATVNFWDFVETAFYLDSVGYRGWVTADVFPKRHDPVKVMEATFAWMDRICALAERLDQRKLRDFRNRKDTIGLLEYAASLLKAL
jgi:xylose isomerase